MAFYISDYRQNFLEETEEKSSKSHESITSIVKREAKKHGKKSREYQLIVKMQNDYSDVAIYTALALSKVTATGGWSLEEILTEIENKPLVDKKYHEYMVKDGDRGMTDSQKKAKGTEICKSILGKEKEQIGALGDFLSKFTRKPEKEKERVDEIVDQVINGIANELEDLSKQNPEQAFHEIEKASKKAVMDNPELTEILTQDHEFDDDEDKFDTAVTELGSLVAKNLRVRSAHMGRRKKGWQ